MSAEHLNTTQPPAPESDQSVPAPVKGRRKAAIIAVLAALALVGAGLTAAFTTRTAPADNVITFGSVAIKTIQQERQADGSLKDVPADYEVEATSGLASRIVTFQNAGASDLYLRARPVMRAVSGTGEDRGGASDVTEFHMDATGSWAQKDGDGWYYYVGGEKNGRLAAATDGSGAGETTTESLMDGIEFVGDFYSAVGPGGKFVFTVEVQAVQADNNGGSALEATGWPAEGTQE